MSNRDFKLKLREWSWGRWTEENAKPKGSFVHQCSFFLTPSCWSSPKEEKVKATFAKSKCERLFGCFTGIQRRKENKRKAKGGENGSSHSWKDAASWRVSKCTERPEKIASRYFKKTGTKFCHEQPNYIFIVVCTFQSHAFLVPFEMVKTILLVFIVWNIGPKMHTFVLDSLFWNKTCMLISFKKHHLN